MNGSVSRHYVFYFIENFGVLTPLDALVGAFSLKRLHLVQPLQLEKMQQNNPTALFENQGTDSTYLNSLINDKNIIDISLIKIVEDTN